MLYDTTNITNSTNIVNWFIASNNLSGGYLVTGLLGGLWLIAFISMKVYETDDALQWSVFFTWIIGLVLWQVGVTTYSVVLFWSVLLVVVFLVPFVRDRIS